MIAGTLLVSEEDAAALAPAETGGKAAGLLKLRESGARVPPWLLIAAGSVAARGWEKGSAGIHLLDAFSVLARPPFSGIMVRSSSSGEDLCAHSGAGRHATVHATQAKDLAPAIAHVAASLGHEDAMAVLLQAAVPATLSGVLFSAHPAAARLREAYLEVVCGAGEALVQGRAAPTRAWVDLESCTVLRLEAGQDGPALLKEALVRELCGRLLAAERIFGQALDIEWCALDDELWIVQARPITALQGAAEDCPGGCVTSWFLDQRFLNPISPMTFSTLVPLILRIAVEEPLRLRREAVPQPLCFRYAGQAYVAHSALCGLLAGLPRCLLTPDLRTLFPSGCRCASALRLQSLPGFIRLGLGQCRAALGNIQAWNRFREALPARLAQVPQPAPEAREAWIAAWQALDALSVEFLRIHRWSILLADYAFWVFRSLQRLTPPGLRQRREAALVGSLDLATVRANAALGEQLRSGTAAAAFVAAFGQRSTSLDYAVPTWAEMLKDGSLQAYYAGNREEGRLSEKRCGRAPLGTGILRCLLEMREEQRLQWERILARQRGMLLDAGARLHDIGRLAGRDEVFLLDWAELSSGLAGEELPSAHELGLRAHAMRVESLLLRPLFLELASESTRGAEEIWRGLAASGGVARGRACMLVDPGQIAGLPEGMIVVFVMALDPAHTPLLARAAGLVVERGGLLSHAAILAREHRKPMVVAAGGARAAIKTGDWVEVDGNEGTIRRVPPPG